MGDTTAMHRSLLEALNDRLAVVADHAWRDRDPVGHLEGLKKAAGRLDSLVANLPADADPMLRHFLERQSHMKARDWLEVATVCESRDSRDKTSVPCKKISEHHAADS